MIPSLISIPREEDQFKIGGKIYKDTGTKFPESALGDIFLVYDDKYQQYILKRAKKLPIKKDTDKNIEMLKNEYDALLHIKKCPNIIKVEGYKEDYTMILLEYAKGGDLVEYINSKFDTGTQISIKTFDILFNQLIEAVNCFHLSGIYNLDIKPDNIVFLDKEQTKLAIIDFGSAVIKPKDKNDDICTGLVGTKEYMAPEIIINFNKNFACSKADVYSLGKVLELLLSVTEDDKQSYEYYEFMKNLIKQMIDIDPKTRISLTDLITYYTSFFGDNTELYGQFKSKKSLKKSKTNKSKTNKSKTKKSKTNKSKTKKSKTKKSKTKKSKQRIKSINKSKANYR
jgi:serine/threonine protein kinase